MIGSKTQRRNGVNPAMCIPAHCSTGTCHGREALSPHPSAVVTAGRRLLLWPCWQKQPLLARPFLAGKTQSWGRWYLHLHLLSSLVFGTAETNLNSLSREGLSDVWQGEGKGPLLPQCVPYILEKAPLPAFSDGKPKCKSVFWLVPVAVSVFSSCQQQLTGQVHPCTAIVTAHWQTSDPAGPDNGKLLISVGSAVLKWMPNIMSSAVLDSDIPWTWIKRQLPILTIYSKKTYWIQRMKWSLSVLPLSQKATSDQCRGKCQGTTAQMWWWLQLCL